MENMEHRGRIVDYEDPVNENYQISFEAIRQEMGSDSKFIEKELKKKSELERLFDEVN